MFGGKPLTGIPRLVGLGVLGATFGLLAANLGNWLPLAPREQTVKAAYLTPKFPGGIALSMAMVHDVIHERYLRHGSVWYQNRNAKMREIMDAAPGPDEEPSPRLLSAMDDLAVGLDRLHQDEEAAQVMRRKLRLMGVPEIAPAKPPPWGSPAAAPPDSHAEYMLLLSMEPLGPRQLQEYTAEANLGTALIHGSFAAASAGDAAARAKLREGLAHIERSIQINPLAHFGRENWQAIIVRHFLACEDHPELLTSYTCVGDSIAEAPHPERLSSWEIRRAMPLAGTPEAELPPQARMRIREVIPTAGVDPRWAEVVKPAYVEAVPFDEPALALIGMWTLGGGPSPHSALALGRIMENMGQRQIAWNAYERAIEMQDRFSAIPEARATLAAACRDRQLAIAKAESPGDVKGWEDSMRRQHAAELAWGEAYQKAYQTYEEQQLHAGVSLFAGDFYDAFFKDRPSIASNPGGSDNILMIHTKPQTPLDCLPLLMLGAACTMLLGYFTSGRR